MATTRSYPDIEANSPNGRFVFESKSPDNAKEFAFFQSNFTLTLTDMQTKAVVWQRKQAKDEAPPCLAVIDDDKWVAVYTGGNQLLLFDFTGKRTLLLDLLNDGFPDQDIKRHVHDTTAGPRWTSFSRWYFVRIANRTHFCLRAGWGRRIIIDVGTSRQVKEDAFVRDVLDVEEAQFAERTLSKALRDLKTAGDSEAREAIVDCALTAINIAGQRRLTSLAPHLRALERAAGFCCSCICPTWESPDGEIDPGRYRYSASRRVVQLALRKMTQKPAGYGVTVFTPEREDHDRQWAEGDAFIAKLLNPPTDQPARADQVRRIKPLMKPEEVLEILGPPDYVDDRWEYDMDSEPPFTLEIFWNEARRIEKVSKVQPVRWVNGGRDAYH